MTYRRWREVELALHLTHRCFCPIVIQMASAQRKQGRPDGVEYLVIGDRDIVVANVFSDAAGNCPDISRLGVVRSSRLTGTIPGRAILRAVWLTFGLVVRIESRPQGLWQELVGDPDLEAAGGYLFDRHHTPIVVMGRRDVNGRLAVWGVVHHTFRVVQTRFRLAQISLSP